MHTLWDHQQGGVDAVMRAWADGVQAPAIQHPTGSGKSETLAEIARLRMSDGPVVIVAPSREIVGQLERAVRNRCGIPLPIDIVEMGPRRASRKAPVVIASAATIGRCADGVCPRLESLRKRIGEPATWMVDEGHRAAPGNVTYRAPLEALRCLDDELYFTGVGPRVLLCSATLARHDRQPIMAEAVADVVRINDLVAIGKLSAWRTTPIYSRRNLDELCERYGGDLDDDDNAGLQDALLDLVMDDDRNRQIIAHYQLVGGGRQFICFTKFVEHAKLLARMFREAGVPVQSIDGKMDKRSRAMAVEGYKRGEIAGLINVRCLAEGADLPSCQIIYWTTPTMSLPYFQQGIGRGFRIWSAEAWNAKHPESPWHGERISLTPVKHDLEIVDVIDACSQHDIVRAEDAVLRDAVPKLQRREIPEAVAAALAETKVFTEGAEVDELVIGYGRGQAIAAQQGHLRAPVPHPGAPARWSYDGEGWRTTVGQGAIAVQSIAGGWVVDASSHGPDPHWFGQLSDGLDWLDELLGEAAPERRMLASADDLDEGQVRMMLLTGTTY